jgi:outer membrane protein OmpA-like peptidoglycan-associated protein
MSPAALRVLFGSCLTFGLVDLAWLDANAARLKGEGALELLTRPAPRAPAEPLPAIALVEPPRAPPIETAPADPPNRPAQPEPVTSCIIQFERSLSVIPSDQVANLTPIAEAAKNDPRAIIRIVGHADRLAWKANRGNNYTLSEDRAVAVSRVLGKLGIAPDRIKRAALGDTRPVDDRATEDAYRRNRRVEVRIERMGDR